MKTAFKVILIAIVLSVFLLPFISGSVGAPDSLHPKDLGYFFASWFNYWFSLAESFLQEINAGTLLYGGGPGIGLPFGIKNEEVMIK